MAIDDVLRRIDDLFDGVEFEPGVVCVVFNENASAASIEKYLQATSAATSSEYVRQGKVPCRDCNFRIIPNQYRECYHFITQPDAENEIFKYSRPGIIHCMHLLPKG